MNFISGKIYCMIIFPAGTKNENAPNLMFKAFNAVHICKTESIVDYTICTVMPSVIRLVLFSFFKEKLIDGEIEEELEGGAHSRCDIKCQRFSPAPLINEKSVKRR